MHYLAKCEKRYFELCHDPKAVLQDHRFLGSTMSAFWLEVDGKLTNEKEASGRSLLAKGEKERLTGKCRCFRYP